MDTPYISHGGEIQGGFLWAQGIVSAYSGNNDTVSNIMS